MMERIAETSPRLKARITGVFYLLTILTGVFAQMFVSGRLVVDGNAAATTTNILRHRGLFQLGFAVYLVEMACNIAMTALFCDLLKPVSRSLSLLAAFFSLTGCVIKILSRLFYIAPLFVLGGANYLNVFGPTTPRRNHSCRPAFKSRKKVSLPNLLHPNPGIRSC